jgi:hypothetical protein
MLTNSHILLMKLTPQKTMKGITGRRSRSEGKRRRRRRRWWW